MAYIQNSEELMSTSSHKKMIQDLITIVDKALLKVDPYVATKKLIKIENNNLIIGENIFNFDEIENIYVIGGGKATYPIAKALEDILGERITKGLVVLKHGQKHKLERIKIIEGGHPIPDKGGFLGAQEIYKIAKAATEKDLVITCITGGSSALLPLPVDTVTLEEKSLVSKVLLSSGASIFEMNSVRKHLSKIKGGLLGLEIFPATLINLTVSDVIGDDLDYITDLTVPDTSSFEDANKVLKKYNLSDKLPVSVVKYLAAAKNETPKNYEGYTYYSYILAGPEAACDAAADEAKKLGYSPIILSTSFDCESRELGKVFAQIANEISSRGNPIKAPVALIGGGESVVTLNGSFGLGGPNQEFALAGGTYLDENTKAVICGVDTDGTDGPTDIAGAMCDASVKVLARRHSIDVYEILYDSHATRDPLVKMGNAIFTGHTGTNVNDLKICLIEN
jgi:hydroxypyruvate reductase/glycerate 2-kinase